MKQNLLKRASTLLLLCASVVSSWAIGGDGLYFSNSFEASDNVPAMADVTADTEMPVIITGQGEWKYYNAFYNDDISTGYMGNGDRNLRLPKKGYGKIGASNGSYVVSPLLNNGVSKAAVVFQCNIMTTARSKQIGITLENTSPV